MTTFSNSPKLLKGGLVSIDPGSAAIQRIVALQYNPESITRSFQIQGVGESGDRSQALRLRGPAVETLKLEAQIDAIDQLEEGDAQATELGIQPEIAALEAMIHPTSAQLIENNALAASGTLEILPMEAPMVLLVWSKLRIVPVRITDLSVTEEAFDTRLNPIRAKVSIGLRVLSVDDLGFDHKGGSLFLGYLQQKESLAAKSAPGILSTLGIGGIP